MVRSVVLMMLFCTAVIAPERLSHAQESTSITATPRVGAPGGRVDVAGFCDGTATIVVTAAARGWDDTPLVLFLDTPTQTAAGGFSTSFSMPAAPALLRVDCERAERAEQRSLTIAPSSSDDHVTLPTPIPDQPSPLPDVDVFGPLEVFTEDGAPVPSAFDEGQVTFNPPYTPVRLVIIGFVSFGENADARQVRGVRAWTIAFEGVTSIETDGLRQAIRLGG